MSDEVFSLNLFRPILIKYLYKNKKEFNENKTLT